MSGRFIIEGMWRGRIVHRTCHTKSFKRLRKWADGVYCLRFTDGTELIITVRDAKPRERVVAIHGYEKLIEDCFYYNVNSVAAVMTKRKDL